MSTKNIFNFLGLNVFINNYTDRLSNIVIHYKLFDLKTVCIWFLTHISRAEVSICCGYLRKSPCITLNMHTLMTLTFISAV